MIDRPSARRWCGRHAGVGARERSRHTLVASAVGWPGRPGLGEHGWVGFQPLRVSLKSLQGIPSQSGLSRAGDGRESRAPPSGGVLKWGCRLYKASWEDFPESPLCSHETITCTTLLLPDAGFSTPSDSPQPGLVALQLSSLLTPSALRWCRPHR